MFNVDNISVIADERLKKIISEVFDSIVKKYGEKNFLRWINESKIDDKIKTLIVEYMNPEEHQYFAGYYSPKANKIVMQDKYEYASALKILIHEFNHFLTPENFREEMTGFIDEGITEYLAQSVKTTKYVSYGHNVDFVAFLHKQLGDILIKSYFTGEVSPVKSKLATYLSPKSDLNSFLSELRIIYDKCYDASYDVTQSVIASKMDFFANTYMQIYLGRIRETAETMGYYSNGNIDQKKIFQVLSSINSTFPEYIVKYMNEHNLMSSYKEDIVRTILNNSHLKHFDYYGNDNIKQYVDAILSGRSITIPNNNAIQTLLLDKLRNRELDLNEYADTILMVINKFPNFNVEDLNKMEFLVDKVGEDKFKYVYDYITSNIDRCNNIDEFVNEHKRNTIESQFRVIVPNWLYLEKRDNKLYIIQMDAKGKVTKETPIDKNFGEDYEIKDLFLLDDEGHFCIPSLTLDADISKIKIYPENSTVSKDVYNLEDFQKLMKTIPFITKLKDRLKQNKKIDNDSHVPFFGVEGVSYRMNNVGVRAYDDYRTIHIDLDGLKNDLDTLIPLFPKRNIEEMIISILKDVLSSIYEIDHSTEIDWCSKRLYDILYNGEPKTSLLDMESLLNHLKQEKNDFVKSKYELSFKDEISKQEYNKRKEEYEAKLERQRKSQELRKEKEAQEIEENKLKSFEKEYRYGYLIYERKPQYSNPKAEFDLPAVKLPQSTREPGFASIDVNSLVRNMKHYMALCEGKKDYEPYISSTIDSAIKSFLEITDTEEGKVLADSLYTIISDAIFNDKEIDISNFNEIINKGNEYISKHADFWPTEVDPERDKMFKLLNDLYVISNPEQFEKVSKMVREYIIAKGYDEYIYQMISYYINLYQFNEEEHKKVV